jgi:hypothetical protein
MTHTYVNLTDDQEVIFARFSSHHFFTLVSFLQSNVIVQPLGATQERRNANRGAHCERAFPLTRKLQSKRQLVVPQLEGMAAVLGAGTSAGAALGNVAGTAAAALGTTGNAEVRGISIAHAPL